MLKKYFGNKEYYLNVLRIGLPLALSNLLNSCMTIVDGVMVSSIGMVTAVGNARNVLTLNDMTEWGVISGISIFGAQFFGAKQWKNMGKTFALCLFSTLINTLVWVTVTYTIGNRVLLFYLNDPEVCMYSMAYLKIVIIAMIPGAIAFSISTMFRCEHKTKLTFIVSTIFSVANCIFNYVFLYVLNMGIEGAAYGTLLAHSLNAITYIVLIYKLKPKFYIEFKEMFKIDLDFIIPVFRKTLPILLNELLFGIGQTMFNKAYGVLGTQSMDAYYVSNEIFNLFTFVIWGFGNAISIIVGTTLGSGDIERAKRESDYQLGMAFLIGFVLSALVTLFAPSLISLYHVTNSVTFEWTKGLLYVLAIKIWVRTLNYMMFSTLKAGGDSKILNLLDSGIMYLVGLPLAFLSVKYHLGNIVVVVLICQIEQFVRFFITLKRYKSFAWANDLTQLVV